MFLYWQNIQIQKIHDYPEWIIWQEIQEDELPVDLEDLAW